MGAGVLAPAALMRSNIVKRLGVERIGKPFQEIVGKEAHEWVAEVTGICLQQIHMPKESQKILSRQVAAEREQHASITKADGDRPGAENLAAFTPSGNSKGGDHVPAFLGVQWRLWQP